MQALMEECSKELVHRFVKLRPNKILTVATTGLVIAVPMAMRLQVPVVYARKQRTMVMSDYHLASYSSRTQGINRELVVSKGHLTSEDRVLIVDDFMSAGSCQDALLRIISEAGAQAVGIAVLCEKSYEKGRTYLSGYNIPIESLVAVSSVEKGRIELKPQ
jgi:xanthine phosphoribosyltransferase